MGPATEKLECSMLFPNIVLGKTQKGGEYVKGSKEGVDKIFYTEVTKVRKVVKPINSCFSFTFHCPA